MTDLERIEAEGMRAAAQGCMGTHNPYLFRQMPEESAAWVRGWGAVRTAMEQEYQRGRDYASLFPWPNPTLDLWAKGNMTHPPTWPDHP